MATVPVNIDDVQLYEGKSEDDADIATETRYGVRADGVVVELHLNEGNTEAYDEALGKFLAAGRPVGTIARDDAQTSRRTSGRRAGSGGSASLTPAQREHNTEVRRWAREDAGASTLRTSGRVPNEIVAAHEKGDIAAVKAWNEARLAKGIEAV